MNKTTIIATVVALVIGGGVGYLSGGSNVASTDSTKVAELTKMITADGEQMKKMGDVMVNASVLLEDRGAKYNDNDLSMAAKDLSVYGTKSQTNGKSMTEGNVTKMDM
ncbi:MAG: hypothetical protein A2845_04410 [Candidatus Lloydbacteria bacterium RIFCSPHIGHO2_01_FULL_49_22]|uniref:Uncharacterized protein n=1 Tax=Candidatus Lloydbacteria bacterium RIFCSPHIGHO2_01_FULL_49_22 TaxID=1798658 RepID=A0A1G2CWT5_9BACT|nr:MAG: hypothetical protein A2845_04410 [Candidatus Lloydbacteria bacterium RIFCSPHIGHO2_01_FULL_49_22]OGZ08893.1 MAG: hypothetical protein A3C14_01445 [Candidatus Lloydbacteria bacterium RIFCSPHIGHO2_02_FULL_50_18]